jgi:hypothetical protein
MPIPTINLIPAAYYLRKKVKVAWLLAGLFIVAEGAGIVALGFWQAGVSKELEARQIAAQDLVDKITAINAEAETKTASAQDVIEKAKFIDSAVNPGTGKNAAWASMFRTLARYTYPGAVVTNITPGEAGTKAVAMHVRIAVPKSRNQVTLMSMVWRNLRLCPIIDKVAPTSYGAAAGDAAGSTSIGGPSMPGMPTAGGPPMPGGPSMPGAPIGGRYMGSGISLAGPAVDGLANYNSGLGGSPMGMSGAPMPTDLSGGLGTPQPSGPPEPPMYDVDYNIELLKPIEVAVAPGTAIQPVQ